MNIAHWLLRTAQIRPDDPALMVGGTVTDSYARFAARAGALAASLHARGVAPGARVAIHAGNCPEYLIAMFGTWIAGAVAVPVNAKLHPKEAAFILDDSKADLVFVNARLSEPLARHTQVGMVELEGADFRRLTDGSPAGITPRAPPDLAWLFYTSGTTGKPKGVQITHGMLEATSVCYPLDVDPVASGDAALYAAPMSHGAGLYAPIHVRMGARHITPPSGGFDPAEILALCAGHGPASMFMAPTMIRRLTDVARGAGAKGEGIKTIVYGGGPMYRADIEEAVDWFGPRFVQIYGQGECPMAISALSRADVADRTHPNWRARLASVGRAQSLVEVAIGGPDATRLPVGHIGEIMVRGAPVMPGYWNNPEATARTLIDGWLMTGDVGRLDEDGYLTLHDRSKDVIISGGTNIYPREIEEVLLMHPSVHEVSVVGRASTEWGEDVVAFVVVAPGHVLDPAALDAFCLDHIARFKRPKAYLPLPELPKNNYGKVLKTALRQRLNGRAT